MSAPAQKYDVFQAVADPTRREVLRLVAEKERPISEIAGHFSMSRTAVAKHLHILSEAKLIKGRKAGREKLYILQPESLAELREWLAYFDRFWDNRLSVLKNLFEIEDSSALKQQEADE
ncbi:metalloregulator ArsR/SmtB family transcription factor [Bacillus infantis]|uniref:ArsR/SmtB family transcription factor n=1 Tax=Bacillus infantis TaxID=324767 RepID=UPI001CD6C956|nr:metalloregulator ArsR/SmtB family transcription factor [Bacillus infantis]MCA1041310.1 metalloregulator ArsR/SmtB family transcription factor [Bacillus infantis]